MKEETMGTNFKIALGAKVKDKVTGYVGVVTGRHEYLYGCFRYTVQAQELKDGKAVDAMGADEEQLEVIKEKTSVTPANQLTGGPGDAGPARRKEPARRADPGRR
jgi:hypothetical protein